jgi:PadR family transcriptional regulator PadR
MPRHSSPLQSEMVQGTLDRGWIAAFWGTSENNRKDKYYRLTPEGKKQLAAQTSRWEQVVCAIGRILNPVVEKQG